MHRRAFLAAAAGLSLSPPARAQGYTRFSAAAAYTAERGGASFIVVRNGIVLAEDYPLGRPDTRWPIGEGTRAFMPLLAATLVRDRLLSLDEPVAMTLGDWGAHPIKSTISVRALLNGTSGLAFGRAPRRDLAAAMTLDPIQPPGAAFFSDDAIYVLFAEIARRKLEAAGRPADPAIYLTERTLLPIGCVPIGWTRGADGAPRFDRGAAVSARAWAQVGELIRRGGVQGARQLADENALREALRGSFAESRAGMGLWLAAPGRGPLPLESDLWRASSPAPADLAMAADDSGQRLYVAASVNLVVVRQASTRVRAPDWSDAAFLTLIWRDLTRV